MSAAPTRLYEERPDVMRDTHDEALGMRAAVRALAGIVLGDADPDAVLGRVCAATKTVVAGADEVSVTLLEQVPRTAAYTGELALRADEIQYAGDEGPCLEAARTGVAVLVTDLGEDDRWSSYLPGARELGVAGSLSVPLEVGEKVVGALNIYATSRAAFDDDAIATAYDVAQYAGIVATARDEWSRATALAEQMRQAMESRAVIEQAKGILMAERRCSAEDAFKALVRASQDSHRKLHEVASLLVERTLSG
jgi:transcriptional regulator with GAF, ATPase, and Fis domain